MSDPRTVDRFPVAVEPTDVLLVADPARVPALAPALLDVEAELTDLGLDERLGLVSTAIGDPATAGRLVPLGLGGWWTPGDPPSTVTEVPSTAPLDALAALSLALDEARPTAALRVLVVVAQDEPSELPAQDLVDDLGRRDAEISVSAPVPVPSLAPVVDAVGGELFATDADPADALDDVSLSVLRRATTFPLSGWPDPATLDVRVEDVDGAVLGFEQGSDYAWDERSNTVRFTAYVPPEGAVVVARYEDRADTR